MDAAHVRSEMVDIVRLLSRAKTTVASDELDRGEIHPIVVDEV